MTKLEEFLAKYEKIETVRTFKWVLGSFCKVIYGDKKNLSQKLERYLTENRNYEKDIENFYISLNGKPPLSKRLMISNLKTFLLDNDIELSRKFWKRLRERNKETPRAVSFDKVPEIEDLRKIFTHFGAKPKALFLILTSSGLRIGEALQLLLSDIDFTTEPVTIRVRAETTKTGSKRITFISDEAIEALQEWLKIREASIETIINRTNRKRKIKVNKNRIFPFELGNASFMWREALHKAKLDQRDSTTGRNKFHVQVLRKFFRTQMVTAMPVDVVEALMGHEGYLNAVYRKYSRKQLRDFYKKAEYTVAIFKDIDKIMKIKKEIGKTKSELEQHNKSLRIQINDLKAKNIELEREIRGEINDLKDQLKRATRIITTLKPILNTFIEFADRPEFEEFKRAKWEAPDHSKVAKEDSKK
jgi:integrase